jgi:endonuclease/exonuclease/phosphatase family metal-dependent hydrolase
MELTLVTWNIHSGVGTDGVFSLERIASVLREIAPDVIALQEVGDFRDKTARADHAEHLARLLDRNLAFGPNLTRGARPYGNALLTRFPIRHHRNDDLSYKRAEPRGALRCDLEIAPGELLHVVSVHLGLGPRERKAQEKLLLETELLRGPARDPVVLCGDWNYLGTGRVASFAARGLDDAALSLGSAQRTCPSPLPVFRFDRVFTNALVTPLAVRVHETRASDHLPLVFRFAAQAAARATSSASSR